MRLGCEGHFDKLKVGRIGGANRNHAPLSSRKFAARRPIAFSTMTRLGGIFYVTDGSDVAIRFALLTDRTTIANVDFVMILTDHAVQFAD